MPCLFLAWQRASRGLGRKEEPTCCHICCCWSHLSRQEQLLRLLSHPPKTPSVRESSSGRDYAAEDRGEGRRAEAGCGVEQGWDFYPIWGLKKSRNESHMRKG